MNLHIHPSGKLKSYIKSNLACRKTLAFSFQAYLCSPSSSSEIIGKVHLSVIVSVLCNTGRLGKSLRRYSLFLCSSLLGKLPKMEPAQIEACVFTVMYCMIMLVSLVGNTLLIYIVWKKPEVRSLTSFMFVNMAVADLLVTLVMMPWSIAFFYTQGKWLIKGAIGETTCRGVIYTATFTVMASILSLTFTALDRFYAVVYPFHRQVWFRKAKFLTPLIWLLSVALMSIIPVTYQLHTPRSECGFNVEVWGDKSATTGGVFVYLFATSYFFPLCATSILYTKTAHNLWFHQAPGNQIIQDRQQRETTKKRVVRNLIIIFTTFALCWLPAQTDCSSR